MRIVNFSEARNELKGLCHEVVKSRKPARIHRRGGDGVVVAAEDRDSIQETLYVTSIPGAAERVKAADDYKELEELSALVQEPFAGLHKPEPLRGDLSGFWSVRLSQRDRLIYRVEGEDLMIRSLEGHDEDR